MRLIIVSVREDFTTVKVLRLALLFLIGLLASLQSPIYAQRSAPIAVGDVAPDFTLNDENGNKVTLSEARGKSPVVLVFYRGYW